MGGPAAAKPAAPVSKTGSVARAAASAAEDWQCCNGRSSCASDSFWQPDVFFLVGRFAHMSTLCNERLEIKKKLKMRARRRAKRLALPLAFKHLGGVSIRSYEIALNWQMKAFWRCQTTRGCGSCRSASASGLASKFGVSVLHSFLNHAVYRVLGEADRRPSSRGRAGRGVGDQAGRNCPSVPVCGPRSLDHKVQTPQPGKKFALNYALLGRLLPACSIHCV